ncbi:MAG: hypothetical protein AAF583_07125 [Pseudomonadota bacterium]
MKFEYQIKQMDKQHIRQIWDFLEDEECVPRPSNLLSGYYGLETMLHPNPKEKRFVCVAVDSSDRAIGVLVAHGDLLEGIHVHSGHRRQRVATELFETYKCWSVENGYIGVRYHSTFKTIDLCRAIGFDDFVWPENVLNSDLPPFSYRLYRCHNVDPDDLIPELNTTVRMQCCHMMDANVVYPGSGVDFEFSAFQNPNGVLEFRKPAVFPWMREGQNRVLGFQLLTVDGPKFLGSDYFFEEDLAPLGFKKDGAGTYYLNEFCPKMTLEPA